MLLYITKIIILKHQPNEIQKIPLQNGKQPRAIFNIARININNNFNYKLAMKTEDEVNAEFQRLSNRIEEISILYDTTTGKELDKLLREHTQLNAALVTLNWVRFGISIIF